MTERTENPPSDLKIVSAIGDEFDRIEARAQKGLRPGSFFLRRSRRVTLVALIGVLTAGTAAGAASGVLDVGSVIPAGEPRGPAGYSPQVTETVLATGTTRVGGPWRITARKSEQISDGGRVVQPAGLPCISFVLTDPPPAATERGRWFCGDRGKGGLNAAALAVSDGSGAFEIILFGQAPEEASAVQLVADGGERVAAQMHQGPEGAAGDIWVMTLPPGLKDRGPKVDWIAPSGRRAGVDLDVSRTLDEPLPRR